MIPEKTSPDDVWPSEIVEAARILEAKENNVLTVYNTVKGDLDHPALLDAFAERNSSYQTLMRLCRARPADFPKKYVGEGSR